MHALRKGFSLMASEAPMHQDAGLLEDFGSLGWSASRSLVSWSWSWWYHEHSRENPASTIRFGGTACIILALRQWLSPSVLLANTQSIASSLSDLKSPYEGGFHHIPPSILLHKLKATFRESADGKRQLWCGESCFDGQWLIKHAPFWPFLQGSFLDVTKTSEGCPWMQPAELTKLFAKVCVQIRCNNLSVSEQQYQGLIKLASSRKLCSGFQTYGIPFRFRFVCPLARPSMTERGAVFDGTWDDFFKSQIPNFQSHQESSTGSTVLRLCKTSNCLGFVCTVKAMEDSAWMHGPETA